jgi:hypothetical protein
VGTSAAVSNETRLQAIDVLRAMVARDRIDLSEFERAITELFEARSEEQFVAVIRSLASPVAVTPAERRLDEPLKIRGGTGRLHLDGRWQLGRQTSVRAELGSVIVDLTEAEFDDTIVDLSIYTGCGRITLVVPPGVGVQLLRSRGTISSQIDPPIPGFPLVRLNVTTNIGKIQLRRHNDTPRRRLLWLRRSERRQLDR